MKQELVFSTAIPLPEDYFAGVEKTSAARNLIGETETKLSEMLGEPVKFKATVQPWKDPSAKPRGRRPKADGTAAQPNGAEPQSAAQPNGSAEPQPPANSPPQVQPDVARVARAR